MSDKMIKKIEQALNDGNKGKVKRYIKKEVDNDNIENLIGILEQVPHETAQKWAKELRDHYLGTSKKPWLLAGVGILILAIVGVFVGLAVVQLTNQPSPTDGQDVATVNQEDANDTAFSEEYLELNLQQTACDYVHTLPIDAHFPINWTVECIQRLFDRENGSTEEERSRIEFEFRYSGTLTGYLEVVPLDTCLLAPHNGANCVPRYHERLAYGEKGDDYFQNRQPETVFTESQENGMDFAAFRFDPQTIMLTLHRPNDVAVMTIHNPNDLLWGYTVEDLLTFAPYSTILASANLGEALNITSSQVCESAPMGYELTYEVPDGLFVDCNNGILFFSNDEAQLQSFGRSANEQILIHVAANILGAKYGYLTPQEGVWLGAVMPGRTSETMQDDVNMIIDLVNNPTTHEMGMSIFTDESFRDTVENYISIEYYTGDTTANLGDEQVYVLTTYPDWLDFVTLGIYASVSAHPEGMIVTNLVGYEAELNEIQAMAQPFLASIQLHELTVLAGKE